MRAQLGDRARLRNQAGSHGSPLSLGAEALSPQALPTVVQEVAGSLHPMSSHQGGHSSLNILSLAAGVSAGGKEEDSVCLSELQSLHGLL